MSKPEAGRPERRSSPRRDTVHRRLRRLVVSYTVLLLVTGVVALAGQQTATAAASQMAAGYGPAGDLSAQTLTYMLDDETATRGYLLTRDPAFLLPYHRSDGKILPTIDRSKAVLARIGDHSFDAAIDTERRAAEAWLQQVARPIAAGRRAPETVGADELGRQMFEQFRQANAAVQDRLQDTRARLRAEVLHIRNRTFLLVGVAVGLALLAGSYLGLRTTRRLLGPLSGLHATVRAMEHGDLSARADARLGPVEVRDVAGAVNRLGAQVEAARAATRAAEQVRANAQPLSESLRIGVEPYTMCQAFVVGLGAVFDVDRVWLHTFDDNRVPGLTVQWHMPDVGSLPAAVEQDPAGLRATANRLWHSSGLLSANADHAELGPELAPLLGDLGAGAALVAAVGDGASAMGVLALSNAGRAHEWTPIELSLINRLCSELAHSLVQNNIVQRQHEVIEQLRALDEAKSALVSTVSHELRTPLTSISGYLEMVLDGDAGALPEQAADMLKVVERNTDRLRNLIEDLLTQSRIEAGRLRVTVTRIDVVDVLREVAGSLLPLAEANGVTVRVDVPDAGVLRVDGDLRQLEQAVTNLVANAIKFTPDGGNVCLEAQLDGPDTVLISVADTGIGIPADELPRLFERFFRASNATQAEIPGTGLGLSIVREIIRAHSGELDVQSQVGVGTSFLIRLARAGAHTQAAAPQARG